MPTKKTVSENEAKMQKAVEVLQDSLKTVRTGRASTGLVENLKVDYYGTPTPLKQMATLAAPQADMVVIKPFDPASIGEIEKAINEITGGYKIAYPHYLGTIDSFISQFLYMPFGSLVMGCKNVRPSIIQDYCVNVHIYIERIWRKECYDSGCKPLDFYYDMDENLCCLNKDLSKCLVKKNKPCITLKKYCYKNGYASYTDMTYIVLKILKRYPDIAKLFCRRF